VHHRGGHRIGTEGEATNGLVLPVSCDLAHDPTDERCSYAVEGDPPQVDVVVGLAAAGQNDLAAYDGLLDDLGTELIPGFARHARSLGSPA